MIEAPDIPFRFGGRRSLDLTWTVRFRAVAPTELLATPADLARWLEVAGLPAPAAPAQRYLVEARRLREAIHRAAEAVVDGRTVDDDDRSIVNEFASRPPPVPTLEGDGVRRIVAPVGREMSASLSAIARDAVDLLAAGDGRLRRCSGPRCSLLFRDDSRPGSRRWCDTATCGNKVNTSSYRRRRRDPG